MRRKRRSVRRWPWTTLAQYGTAVAKAAEAAGIKPLDAAAMDKLKEEVDYEAIEGELAELQAVADDVNAEKV